MVYIIICFGLFIVFVIGFICVVSVDIMDLKLHYSDTFNIAPMVIERAYRAVDLRSSVAYIDEDFAMRYGHNFNSSEKIIHNESHKKHIIEDMCISLTRKMISDGLVEIKDTKDPYRNTIECRVKVYKPE